MLEHVFKDVLQLILDELDSSRSPEF